MKTLITFFASLLFTAGLFAEIPAPAKTTAAYPLDTCAVSGDKLGGDMGEPYDYVYKQDGQPDRLIRLCCKSCLKDFLKEPAVYLKAIDKAQSEANVKAGSTDATNDGTAKKVDGVK